MKKKRLSQRDREPARYPTVRVKTLERFFCPRAEDIYSPNSSPDIRDKKKNISVKYYFHHSNIRSIETSERLSLTFYSACREKVKVFFVCESITSGFRLYRATRISEGSFEVVDRRRLTVSECSRRGSGPWKLLPRSPRIGTGLSTMAGTPEGGPASPSWTTRCMRPAVQRNTY